MGSILLVTVLLLSFSSVASAQSDNDAAIAQAKRAIASCNSRLEAGQFKRRMDYASCVNRANSKAWAGTRHWDLFQNAGARELAAAEAFDQGRMTELQYKATRSQIGTDLISEAQRRESYSTQNQPPQVIVVPPPPVIRGPMNCFTISRMTTCY